MHLIVDSSCRVTSTYMFPYKEDLCRFDFNVDPEDEYMCNIIEKSFTGNKTSALDGVDTPPESSLEAPTYREH
jgi:hypothetical protein